MAARIVLIGNRLGIGGVENLTRNYCDSLVSTGVRPVLAVSPFAGSARIAGVDVLTYSKLLLKIRHFRDALFIVLPDTRARIVGLLLLLLNRKPLFIFDSVRPFFKPEHSAQKLVTHVVERVLLRVGLIVPTYQAVADLAHKTGAAVLAVLPNPVSGIPLRSVYRTEAHDPVRLLYLGRLEKEKGVDLMIALAKELSSRDERFSMRVTGDGSLQSYLAQEILRLNLGANVELHSATQNPTFEYVWADIVIVPSRSEGPSLVCAEAMCQALPVICTLVPGNGPSNTIGGGGLTVPTEDVTALADAVRTVAQHYGSFSDAALQRGHSFQAPAFGAALSTLSRGIKR